MVGRAYNPALYRFGFNKGSEKDNEIAGVGNHFTTKDREGDTRIATWWGVDPKTMNKAGQSPYTFMDGNPIVNSDKTGDGIGDMLAGYFIGGVTNLIPGSTHLRDYYNPSNANDYNNSLRATDVTLAVIGAASTDIGLGGTILSGGTLAPASVPLAITGALVTANAVVNMAAGYNYGKNSSSSDENSSTNENSNSEENNSQKPAQEKSSTEQVQNKSQDESTKVHGNSTKSTKPSQKYTIQDQNGKPYHGVGDVEGNRAEQSVVRLSKDNPGYDFSITDQQNFPTRGDAYIEEQNAIENSGNGAGSSDTYNKINSPGKKLIDQQNKNTPY